MARTKEQQVQKRKVKAYPFTGTALVGTTPTPLPIEVVYLSQQGLIARVKNQILQVGAYCQVQFELPVHNESVLAQVRVLKTYDRALDGKGHLVQRMVEFHFINLSEEHRNRVVGFVTAIGQK